jgi:tRNA A37 N6-isopentenylltransferase MiaA
MQYAKRQMTYFRHQFEVEWFAEAGAARERVERFIDDTKKGSPN